MLSVKGYPSHLLHRSFTFTLGFIKRVRLRIFFRTVTNSILHFTNIFPHCYGDARYRTGIFFCTVTIPIADFIPTFLIKPKYTVSFWELSDRLEFFNGQIINFIRYVKDTPSHIYYR